MVTIGGIATLFMLHIVVVAGLWFRFGTKDQIVVPGKFYKMALIISCISIFMVGIYGVLKLF